MLDVIALLSLFYGNVVKNPFYSIPPNRALIQFMDFYERVFPDQQASLLGGGAERARKLVNDRTS